MIINNDCISAMINLINNDIQVDSVITDPPYELGFMGKSWDKTGIAYNTEMWKLCFQLLKPGGHLLSFGGSRTYHRMACAIEDAGFEIRDQIMWVYGSGFPKSLNVGNGFGTALKPAHEPIVLARKPIDQKTVAANVLKHGTGAINTAGCRVGSEVLPAHIAGQSTIGTFIRHNMVTPERVGRFPANLIHDGSSEVTEKIGTASRFFYCAKAPKNERQGSKHPTIKPLTLMRYLCKLITPPGGTILDPFAGTGTTGQAAILEGFGTILIEREAEYIADIEKRLEVKK